MKDFKDWTFMDFLYVSGLIFFGFILGYMYGGQEILQRVSNIVG